MFTDPLKNLKAFGIRENDIMVDLGAGSGYYSVVAGALAPRGKVYAVEIQKDFLDVIKHKIKDAHLNNVEIIWGNVEKVGGTKIGAEVADAVISSNILFQVEDKDSFISEIKRMLKHGGKVLLIDWSEDSIMKGTKLVSREKARLLFEKNGFSLEREIDAGAHHYGMIFIKA